MAAPSTSYAEVITSLVDIHEADYGAFYTIFGAGANAAQPANATIRDAIIGATNTYPKVFIREASDPPMISCLLQPTWFTAPMGIVSPWANQVFCLNGDILAHGHPCIVELLADAFAQCTTVRALTVAEVDTLWMVDPAAESLGPFNAATPNKEDVQCRFLCPLQPNTRPWYCRKRRAHPALSGTK